MKYCKQCDCHLPDDYDLDVCPICLEDTEGLIPDSVRGLDENDDRVTYVKKGWIL
jgi:hypothetical protein